MKWLALVVLAVLAVGLIVYCSVATLRPVRYPSADTDRQIKTWLRTPAAVYTRGPG